MSKIASFTRSAYYSLMTEYRVITALMLRETHTIYGRSSLGYLWVIFQSLIRISMIWLIREFVDFIPPNGIPIYQFIVIGYVLWSIVSETISKIMTAVAANRALLTFPQVTELDVMIARMLVVWFTQIVVLIVLLFGFNAYFADLEIASFGDLLLVFFYAPIFSLGVGLTLSSFAVFIPSIERLVPTFIFLLLFVSGVIFSARVFSQEVLDIFLYNPIYQLVELSRAAIFYGYQTDGCSWYYLMSLCCVFLSVGLLMESYVRSRRQE